MKKEASSAKMLAVLTGISLLSAAVLGYIYISTYDKIEENRQAQIQEAVYAVLPGITDYEEIQREPLTFKGEKDGQTVGYAVLAQGMGFQGNIVLMAGIDAELENLTGVMILETAETPGLGDRIRTEEYLGQFRGLDIKRSDISVDTITGATLSSEAVEKIVSRAVRYAQNIH